MGIDAEIAVECAKDAASKRKITVITVWVSPAH